MNVVLFVNVFVFLGNLRERGFYNIVQLMIPIPQISSAVQAEHQGESVAIVDGRVVAFGKDSLEAELVAIQKGHRKEEVMTTSIMGRSAYAL